MNSTITRTTEATATKVTAVLDADAPARLHLPRGHYDAKLREPDFVDVDGTSAWMHPEGVVTVPATRLKAFRRYMSVRGLMRVEPATWQIHMAPDTWENLTKIVGR